MPRVARKKNNNWVYHVMCRSISEVDLFKNDEDKTKYLGLLKEYKEVFQFKIYCYCLMDNHCHIIIDTNGTDISMVFQGINYKYAMYFNKRYERHGHLFQDRFKSKIIDSDKYLLDATSYIHANPLSLDEYKNKVEEYEYSSLGVYLGIRKDELDLIDHEFVRTYFPTKDVYKKQLYLEFVRHCKDEDNKDEIEFKNYRTIYLCERDVWPRDYNAAKIIEFLIHRFNISEDILKMKNSKTAVKQRALFVALMRCLCNYKNEDICNVIGNISRSRISMLSSIGKELICNDIEYKGLINEFLKGDA